MMKKKVAIMCIFLMLTGCNGENEADIAGTQIPENENSMETVTEAQTKDEENSMENATETHGKEGENSTETVPGTQTKDDETVAETQEQENPTETMLDLEKYSLENKERTDAQPEFMWNRAASSDLGIYYWGDLTLNFYDKNAKVSVPLCNRPNCNHDSNACNAAFGIFTSTGWEVYRSMVYYYNGTVFLVGDEKNNVNLYKVKADGSSWETYMTLFKAEKTTEIGADGITTTSWRLPDVCLHRNYVYYIDNSESHPKLRRIQMKGTQTEVIFEPEGDRTMLYRMKCYGDFVFFQAGRYEGEELKAGIYAYNVQTGEVCLVKADVLREYYVVENILYYTANEMVYAYDLKTGEVKAFSFRIGDIQTTFFVDKNGIYLFDNRFGELKIYDKSGNLECVIADSQVRDCLFGTDGIFYGEAGSGEGHANVFLHIEDARNGDGNWVYTQ